MAQDNDPGAAGIVSSLARPGGNITGLSNFSPELAGKRLEILKEVVPKLSRVALLGDPLGPSQAQIMKVLEPFAKTFDVKLQYLDVSEPKDIETAFQATVKERADGILTLASINVVSQRAQIVELAAKNRLLAIPATVRSAVVTTIASSRKPGG
jgi:ABC-type uncharacterized transport system substrate-binding protein